MKHIFYIIGKSSSGKDSIYNKLLDSNFAFLKKIILYTTRPIRENEVNGKDYYFVTNEKFEQFLSEGKVVEYRSYNVVGGVWTYFTLEDENINLEKNDYITIGTLESFEKVKNYFGEDKVIPIYVYVNDYDRLKRALERERIQNKPNYKEMCRRFLADEEDFSKANLEKNKITNYFENKNLDDTIERIKKYILEIQNAN